MTVAELIAELERLDFKAIVKTDAGEGAWADAEEVIDCGWSEYEGHYIVAVGPKK